MSEAQVTEDVKHIPLEHRHIELGGRMVPFAGFLMPVQYSGIKEEHQAVRTGVGLFDVSHMGEVEIVGADAIEVIDGLVTNDASRLKDGQAMYAALCNEAGGIVDDVLVYRLAADHVLVCVNASRRAEDFAHMTAHAAGGATITDTSDDYVQLALQGPDAPALLKKIAPGIGEAIDGLRYYRAMRGEVAGVEMLISRTGYTGEDGFELYIPVAAAEGVFDAILKAGEAFGLRMCGLGARDTLRLEAKFNLYGQDMSEATNPIEAGLGWTVKLDKKTPFVGQEAIRAVKEEGVSRRLRGLVLQEKGIIRPGYGIFVGDEKVGEVTSGSWAPTLEESIGLGYIDVDFVDAPVVDVQIRKRRVPARLTNKPFYKRS
jgi:aminomethyltransferase